MTTHDVSALDSPRALLKDLQEKFPVFGNCLPLAIGVDKQLFAKRTDVSRKMLRTALGMHTHSLRYLKALEKATVRFNLDGSQADAVTEEHRAHALVLLKERLKKSAEKHKQEAAEEEAERLRADKLDQLARKFSRQG